MSPPSRAAPARVLVAAGLVLALPLLLLGAACGGAPSEVREGPGSNRPDPRDPVSSHADTYTPAREPAGSRKTGK